MFLHCFYFKNKCDWRSEIKKGGHEVASVVKQRSFKPFGSFKLFKETSMLSKSFIGAFVYFLQKTGNTIRSGLFL